MDMEIACTDNSATDFAPHSLAQNPGASVLYHQIGTGINHHIMEDQFRNDLVEDLVDNSTQNNQYPATASQQPLDEDQLDDDCKRMCILMLFFDLKMKWRAENSQFKIS
jgi:hypothetical protein